MLLIWLLGLAVLARADLTATQWTSDSLLPIKSAVVGAWEKPPMKFIFTEAGNIEVTVTSRRATLVVGRRRIFDPSGVDISQEPPALRLADDGSLTLVDYEANVLTTFANASTPEAGPFTGMVEYDRKFRIRNAASDIVWEFPGPNAPRKVLDSNKYNLLTTGEKLVSDDGQWWITVNERGQVVSNTGVVLNESPMDAYEPHVLVLNEDGRLRLHNAYGDPVKLRGVPETVPSSPAYYLRITAKGALVLQNGDGTSVWEQDLSGRPSDLVFQPIAQIVKNRCAYADKGVVKQGPCQPSPAQLWALHEGKLHLKGEPGNCLTLKEGRAVVARCSDAVAWRFNDDDGTLASGDRCLDDWGQDGELVTSDCHRGVNQMYAHGTADIVPSGLDYQPIRSTHVNKHLLTNFDTRSIQLVNANDDWRGLFANDRGLLRIRANPAFCVTVQQPRNGERLTVARCAKATKWVLSAPQIRPQDTNMCIDLPEYRFDEGTATHLWECSRSANQDFVTGRLDPLTDHLTTGQSRDVLYEGECLRKGDASACLDRGVLVFTNWKRIEDQANKCAGARGPLRVNLLVTGLYVFDVYNQQCWYTDGYGPGQGAQVAYLDTDGRLKFQINGRWWNSP